MEKKEDRFQKLVTLRNKGNNGGEKNKKASSFRGTGLIM